jgi:hypothetical protein
MQAISIARLTLFNLLLALCVDAQAAVTAGLFRHADAPVGTSKVLAKRLADIDGTFLLRVTKAERIEGLLDLAQRERQLDPIDTLRYARVFNGVEDGDALLLACLQKAGCHLQDFSRNAVASPLHREIARRDPALGWVQANHAVGALSERVMHRFFTSSGWEALPGEIGRQGIDGLFVKRRGSTVSDVLVVESKYNTSALQDTLTGTQMSDAWVRAKVKALRSGFPDNPDYTQVQRIVEAGSYRGVLWKLGFSDGKADASLQRVISRDTSVALEPMNEKDTLLASIDSLSSLPPANVGRSLHERLQQWMQEEIDLMFPKTAVR